MAQSAPIRERQRRAAPASPSVRAGKGARGRRRRIAAVLLAAAVGAGVASAVTGLGPLGEAVRAITLPLNHEDVIRQQAREKDIDPALIAAVIYEESKFQDQTSHVGARGLMQITPATAQFIARDSGGTRFTQADLATPQINISYGAYYLRYLLRRYEGNETLAIAAYNAGETHVNRWLARAGGSQAFDVQDDIPFPETRKYVEGVLHHRGQYREHYAEELGL